MTGCVLELTPFDLEEVVRLKRIGEWRGINYLELSISIMTLGIGSYLAMRACKRRKRGKLIRHLVQFAGGILLGYKAMSSVLQADLPPFLDSVIFPVIVVVVLSAEWAVFIWETGRSIAQLRPEERWRGD